VRACTCACVRASFMRVWLSGVAVRVGVDASASVGLDDGVDAVCVCARGT